MNYRDIDLAEGQRAVFNVTVTAPAGTDTTLTGGVTVRADDGTETDYRMTAAGTQLTAGAMPVGRWVYEIRAGGRTVVYGFLVVHPSPLAPDNGESVWQITGDLGTAEVQIELADGLRGDVTPEAEQARIDAQAAATAAQTAGSAAETARISALNAAAAATSAADRAAQQATEAGTAATAAASAADDAAAAQTAAESAKTAAETAQGAAETARNVAVQAAAVYDAHIATSASYETLGHVKLGENVTAASAYAAKVTVDETGRLAVRKATTSVVGCVKLGTGVEVASDAGMVGVCSNGGLGVRKASTNSTTGVGCVRLASSLTDTGDVAVTTASQVLAAIQGTETDIMPDQSPSEGEWQALLLPASVFPAWPVSKIKIPSFVTANATPLYLAAYIYTSTEGETRIGVSTSPCTWDAGGGAEWEFTRTLNATGNQQLRLYLITDTANAGASSCTVISGHVKSYYVATGSCSVMYSGAWYGNRSPQLTLVSSPGHAETEATATARGHVYIATGADDTRATAVITAAQFAALVARVEALETAAAAATE